MIEVVAKDNVKLSEKQLDELINLMEKEEVLEKERRIQAALEQEMKQSNKEKKKAQEEEDSAEQAVKQVLDGSDTKTADVSWGCVYLPLL